MKFEMEVPDNCRAIAITIMMTDDRDMVSMAQTVIYPKDGGREVIKVGSDDK